MQRQPGAWFAALLLLPACAPLPLDEAEPHAWVVYDPQGGDVPLPNDLLRDADAGRLDLPLDGALSDADKEFRTYLNSLDGWSTTFPIAASFSEPVDPSTVTYDTVQVWEWGTPPVRVAGTELALDADGTGFEITPPRAGWTSGGRYAVLVVGGDAGVHTAEGGVVGPDAAMWYLRQDEPLDDPAHEHAFPGATRAARLKSAATLEKAREGVAPWIGPVGVDREDIAALWTFSVTQRTELAMDRPSQRIPLPFDLLVDPETGLVDLTLAPWDKPYEADAKRVANKLRGFGLSSDPFFEVTRGLDPSTASQDTIQLWDVTATPVRVPSGIKVMNEAGVEGCTTEPYARDCKHVFLTLPPNRIPLDPQHVYAIVVTDGLKDRDGQDIQPMAIGHFMKADVPVAVDGKSAVSNVPDADAARLEGVRAKIDALLDNVGREDVVTAWPFTTMDPLPAIIASSNRAADLGLDVPPSLRWRRPASSLIGDDAIGELFPGGLNPGPALYLGRTAGVRQVISGTLPAPDYLDDVTRRWKDTPDIEPLPFWAAVPSDYSSQRKLPVVIFGHAIVTDSRFMLTIAGELVQRGFVVVSIDFPYHGERTSCVESSLVAVPNFFPPALQSITGFTDELIWLPPCASGDAASCSPTGQCLDARGRVEAFNSFPILDMKPASGAAFLDTADLPHIPDHFHQALTDLSTLAWSLQSSDWEGLLQQRIDPDQIYFVGQSLGSIIGVDFVAGRDDIQRAVFNVPGSNLVDLFRNSVYFKPQIDAYFQSLGVADGSYEQARLVSIATWLVDTVDPHSVGRVYQDRDFPALMQMDRVDGNTGDLIIPNFTTENLQRVSGLQMKVYSSVLHADLIVPLIGDAQLSDLGDYLGRVQQ